MTFIRGEVWLADLNPIQGHEQAGVRPVLVISANEMNRSRLELVVVLPITSKPRPFPSRVAVTPPEGGLTMLSQVICEQPRTVSWARFKKRLGTTSPATMDQVERVIRPMLGL